MKRICLLAVGVVVLAFPSAPQAQRPNVLEGLPAVRVVIALDQNANDAGLIDGSLKTAVELRLRQSRILVGRR